MQQLSLMGNALELFECKHCSYRGYDADWIVILKKDSENYGKKQPFCPRCGWDLKRGGVNGTKKLVE